MNEKVYKREAIELLFEHLSPLAKALNNLAQLIEENIEVEDGQIVFYTGKIDGSFIEEIIANARIALDSLEQLFIKIQDKIENTTDDEIAVNFYTNFSTKVLRPNIKGITLLSKWLDIENTEHIELDDVIEQLFVGIENLTEFVKYITSDINE